ncbi:hypothetical protein ON010_g10615 [Phytophthora cinnamomi]|nr:hypothetical protein ON010_g10615 [Phytophthora cinnamomi]
MSDTQLADQFLYQSSLKSDPTVKVSAPEWCGGSTCLRDGFIKLPYKVTMKNTGTGMSLTAAANRLSVDLKCVNWNVVDSMSLELNAEASLDYVNKHGSETFFYPDKSGSLVFNSSGHPNGDGYSNMASDITHALQNYRFSSGCGQNTNGWATVTSGAANVIPNQFGRGAFVRSGTTVGSIAGTWNYMLKIRLVDLHPIFKELDFMINPQIRLRLRINQGNGVIGIGSTASAGKNITFGTTTLASELTCHIMVVSANGSAPNSGVIPSVQNSGTTTVGQFTVAWGVVTNVLDTDTSYFPFTTARLYMPRLNLENPHAIISKPNKNIHYLDYYAQWFSGKAGTGALIS